MNKKILLPGALLITATPLAAVISCGHKEKEYLKDFGLHAYMYDKKIQDSSTNIKVKMDFTRDQISQVPIDIAGHYGSRMGVGGYGEERHFYEQKNSIHLGLDVFAPVGTPILAPADSEVINAVWRHRESTSNFAHGSGGNLLIRTKIKDLPIDDNLKELVYMKYYLKQKNVLSATGYREEMYMFAMPKVKFLEHGKYVKPTNTKYDVSVDHFTEISIVTKDAYDKYVNTYTPASTSEPTKDELIQSSKYVYMSYMHLSKKTIGLYGKTVTFPAGSETWIVSKQVNMHHTPHSVKKGDIIGYVGSQEENGGWSTHTHVEVHMPSLLPQEFISLKRVHKWFREHKYPVFGTGTYSGKTIKDFKTWSLLKGTMNPNNIYHFYNDKTRTVTVRA